jgi:hypothetical protein
VLLFELLTVIDLKIMKLLVSPSKMIGMLSLYGLSENAIVLNRNDFFNLLRGRNSFICIWNNS